MRLGYFEHCLCLCRNAILTNLFQTVKRPIIDLCREFRLCRVASPFDRRVTAIEWHPTQNSIVAVGSKGGDIILWNTETVDKDKFVAGVREILHENCQKFGKKNCLSTGVRKLGNKCASPTAMI